MTNNQCNKTFNLVVVKLIKNKLTENIKSSVNSEEKARSWLEKQSKEEIPSLYYEVKNNNGRIAICNRFYFRLLEKKREHNDK